MKFVVVELFFEVIKEPHVVLPHQMSGTEIKWFVDKCSYQTWARCLQSGSEIRAVDRLPHVIGLRICYPAPPTVQNAFRRGGRFLDIGHLIPQNLGRIICVVKYCRVRSAGPGLPLKASLADILLHGSMPFIAHPW